MDDVDRPNSSEKDSPAVGPLSMIAAAMNENVPVLINCRNNKKLLARIKAFDRHCNMVLENVTEFWTEKRENKQRKFQKLFIRGDTVVLVLRAPSE